MPRILAIDYGYKRTGLAHTDLNKMIASPLETVLTKEIFHYLTNYFNEEDVETIVVGNPKKLNNEPALISNKVQLFINKLKKNFSIPVYLIDERFTSKIAVKSLVAANMKKTKRQDKAMIDQISATLILQSFLDRANL